MRGKLLIIVWSILSFLFFFPRSFVFIDPDFGWHLKMGELILEKGIPKTDPFSYSMPSFPVVSHEWLSDIFIFLGYNASPVILYAVFSLIPIIAMAILLKKKAESATFVVLLLSTALLSSFVGIRVQVVSWFLFSVLLTVVLSSATWKRFGIITPLIILLWANLHGSFPVGIMLIGILVIARFLKHELRGKDVGILAASFLATFINPYGVRLWGEVFSSIGDSSLRFEIIEWVPSIFFLDLSFIALIALTLAFSVRYFRKLSVIERLLLVVFFLFGLSSVRHLPFLILVNLVVFQKMAAMFYQELKNKEQRRRLSVVIGVFAVFSFIILLYKYNSLVFFAGSQNIYPSDKAITFLEENVKEGEVFSSYNWGGYLIQNFPERKVFIDGRMPSWKWEAPDGESGYAFGEYRKIVGGDFNKSFEKFNVSYVLWPERKEKSRDAINLIADLLTKQKGEETAFEERLKKEGWRIIFEDETSVVFEKP